MFSRGAFKDKSFREDVFSRGACQDRTCGEDLFSGGAFKDKSCGDDVFSGGAVRASHAESASDDPVDALARQNVPFT